MPIGDVKRHYIRTSIAAHSTLGEISVIDSSDANILSLHYPNWRKVAFPNGCEIPSFNPMKRTSPGCCCLDAHFLESLNHVRNCFAYSGSKAVVMIQEDDRSPVFIAFKGINNVWMVIMPMVNSPERYPIMPPSWLMETMKDAQYI